MSNIINDTKARRRRRNRRRWLISIGVVLTLLAVAAGLWFWLRPIAVESLELSPASASLKVGDSLTLTCSIYPPDATDTTLIYQSSNSAVARVDAQNGTLTAVGEGACYVSATASSGVKTSLRVTVDAPLTDQEAALLGDWVIFALRESTDGDIRYVYNNSGAISLLEDRTGSLSLKKEDRSFPDWRYAQSIEGFEVFSAETDRDETLSLYYCTDTASAYRGCLMLSLPDGRLFLFHRPATSE